MTARLVLQDPKPSIHGAEGSVTYRYATPDLTMASVDLSFACPTGFDDNAAGSSQPDWVTLGEVR
ncbi:hypothetical protein MXD61_02055 [Frankia sp. AgPm24]|uniref:hypothetical protein n=1 Tax=Frankia sp. AgPm24 TaxID=631128 RepID=UPI00201040BF|nr:hypothetical protein [Frankia sp. AgPm24]MCK9920702.1 hypothetical protein [Frankia sp. AgPm24]